MWHCFPTFSAPILPRGKPRAVVQSVVFGLMSLPLSLQATTLESEFTGLVTLEQKVFFSDGLFMEQANQQASIFIEPELYIEWNDANDSVLFKPFARWDEQDSERSHIDIRELLWTHVGDDWEFRAGVGRVFWGQTESQHLVDVINQTDAVEAIDGEDKLGQPMLNMQWIKDWGTVSAFVLPYFRERTFAGEAGRLRAPLPVAIDDPIYESGSEQRHVDWALRWSHSLDIWELGVAYFDGTSREPVLVPSAFEHNGAEPELQLRPMYLQMQQWGVDVLAVVDAWLLKFEGIHRETSQDQFWAMTTGFEYTLVGVFESFVDVGVLMEYQYDERGVAATSTGQNDLMLGTRIALNDADGTEILLGLVQDLDYGNSRSGFIEASSRINDYWKWRVDAWFFQPSEPQELSYTIRKDDYIQLSIERYF